MKQLLSVILLGLGAFLFAKGAQWTLPTFGLATPAHRSATMPTSPQDVILMSSGVLLGVFGIMAATARSSRRGLRLQPIRAREDGRHHRGRVEG